MKYCPYCQHALEHASDQCPSCRADLSHTRPIEPDRTGPAGSLIESAERIRAAIRAQEQSTQLEKPEPRGRSERERADSTATALPVSPAPVKSSEDGPAGEPPNSGHDDHESARRRARRARRRSSRDRTALPFRPVNRPPMLALCVLDDGSRIDGQWHRIRNSSCTIGRTEGDVLVPNDDGISGRHAEIMLRVDEGRYRYYLRDLKSTNGTFVRVSRAVLKEKQEVLIGSRRYYFTLEAAWQAQSAAADDAEGPHAPGPSGRAAHAARTLRSSALATQPGHSLRSAERAARAALVEMTPDGDGKTYLLTESAATVGTDAAQCAAVIEGDPFVSPMHARLFEDDRGWVVENQRSRNGVWLRVPVMPLDTGGEFQLGEQRFLVRIP